jgi:hypothetical protein
MHKQLFCQNLLDSALKNSIHAKRKQCLVRFLSDLMDYDTTLSVTEIGKKLTSKSTVKSKIYAAQTLVNNFKLERDIFCIYKHLAHFFWPHAKDMVILIDWTGACSDGYHVLEASIAAHGRSIPIYHEVHSESDQENAAIHRQFLLRLNEVIPAQMSVTIVTDAGFHREWFQQVIDLGWHVIGRIYSLYCYQIDGETGWRKVKEIVFEGLGKASAVGKVQLGKTKKAVEGYLYTYKERRSGKKRKKKNKYPSHDKAHSDYYKKGWVLFSSLDKPAQFLVSYYKKRMQIEQNFKDIKNERLGLGLRRNQSAGKTRVNMLFFLAVLLIMIAWWFGLMIESLNKHRAYQANTIKHKRVRSFIHLARMAYRHEPELLNWTLFLNSMSNLQQQYHSFIECGVLI